MNIPADLESLWPNAVPCELVESLLNHLVDAPYFMKDADLRYVSVNTAMLRLCGVERPEEMIGRTASEFFPSTASTLYESYDRRILATGKPMKDQLALIEPSRGARVWLFFSRWPVLSSDGAIIGVAASGRVLRAPDRRRLKYKRLAAAIDYIAESELATLEVHDIAREANVSMSQLKRDFIELFGVPPKRYLSKVKLETAVEMLRSDLSIAEVAHAAGFTDQSAFTRRFRAAVGMSPSQYRQSIRKR